MTETGGRSAYIGVAEAQRIKKLLETFTQREVAAIVKRQQSCISGLKKRGFTPAFHVNVRPRPSDWGLYAPKMTQRQLAQHYRAADETVRRWEQETGIKRKRVQPKPQSMPIPHDLAAKVKELGPNGAAEHYGVGKTTMSKWRHALGLPFKSSWNNKPRSNFGWWERKAA